MTIFHHFVLAWFTAVFFKFPPNIAEECCTTIYHFADNKASSNICTSKNWKRHIYRYIINIFLPVQFWDSIGSSFSNIWRHVWNSFFQWQHHDWYNDWNSDARKHPQCTSSYQLIWVLYIKCKKHFQITDLLNHREKKLSKSLKYKKPSN